MQLRHLSAVLPFIILLACDRASDDNASAGSASVQDSLALARELGSSLSGDVSPGGQNYSYRGLYAGMTREHLESSVRDTASQCTTTAKPVAQVCHYEVTLAPDEARLAIDATYLVKAGDTTAVVIDIQRPLPLSVDGVALARRLADAFERQTRLLDHREASFALHRANVRIGTTSGANQNFVDVIVESKAGREFLTVRLHRSTPSG